MTLRVVSVDDVCKAVQASLEARLPAFVRALGYEDQLKRISATASDLWEAPGWSQAPQLSALSEVNLPAGVISSPGLTSVLRGNPRTGYDVVWRVVVGVLDRGETYDDTAMRVRHWAAAVRAAALSNQTLGGLSRSVEFVTEQYSEETNKQAARTKGGCVVGLDVTVTNAVSDLIFPIPPDGPTGVVESTWPVITNVPIAE